MSPNIANLRAEISPAFLQHVVFLPPVDVAPPQRYRVLSTSVDYQAQRAPFVFPPETNPNVFKGVSAGSPDAATLARYDISTDVGGAPRARGYYQDRENTWLFYYVPDAFKLGRSPYQGYPPLLTVRYTGDTPADTNVTLQFFALPVTDPTRLAAAAAQLKTYVKGPSPDGSDRVRLLPLLADRSQLAVAMTPDPTVSSVSLRDGLTAEVTMPLASFVQVYNSLFSSLPILRGQVDVALGGGGQDESVDIEIAANDAAGPLVDIGGEWDDGAGAVHLSLSNPTGSTVTVHGASLELATDAGTTAVPWLPGAAAPVLAPGARTDVSVPVAADGAVHGVEVHGIDATATWEPHAFYDAVVDRFAPQGFQRTVEVSMAPGTFNAPQGGGSPIVEVIVKFTTGESVTFTPDDLKPTPPPVITKEAKLTVPLSSYVVDGGTSGQFSYHVTALHENGDAHDSGPLSDNSDFPVKRADLG